MKINRLLVSAAVFSGLAFFLFNPPHLQAQDAPLDKAHHHIYVGIGQSNMCGRATIEAQDSGYIDRVFLLKPGDTSWEKATNPINKYTSIGDNNPPLLGPCWGFAKIISASQTNISIGLIGNARGGTSLSQWVKGTTYFSEAVRRTRSAQKTGTLKGILWHQGENDDTDTNYVTKLAVFIKDLRDSLGDPNLLFVAGQIYASSPAIANWNRILMQKLPQLVPNTAVISSDGCTMNSDNLHFNSAGQRLLGSRYGDTVLMMNYVPLPKYALTTSAGTGGSISPASGSLFDSGAVVTITATANTGYVFSGWSGDLGGTTNPTTITMNGNQSVSATFRTIPQYALTTSAGTGGTITPASGSLFDSGAVVTITATANTGYVFSGWSGDLGGTTNPTTITMNGNHSVSATFTTAPLPPSAPTNLSAGSITTTTATLSWTAPGGATSYNIQASVNSDLSAPLINQTGFSGASDPITGLTAGTTYYWRVSAANAGGTSGWAVPSPTTFTTLPSSPSGALSTVWFQGSATTGLPSSPATLKGNLATSNTGFGTGWTPTIALASGTPGPYHWYSNALSGTCSAGTWKDTTITNAATGSYTVALYQTNSDGSNPVQIGSSTTVTNHTGGGNNINVATITTGSPITFSNQRLRLTVTWVSGSVTMAFAVTAFGSQHGPSMGTPAIMGGPPAPTNLAVTGITTTTATLSWTASGGATSYNIQASVNSDLSTPLINQTGFSGTSDSITGLAPGTTYYWRVSAMNASGTSGWAVPSPTSFTTAPLPPTGLTYSTNPAVYTKGVAIAANTATTSGGGAVVSFSVSPALPAGLALNTTSGAITGTPTAVTATASYTVTASNTGGSATASLTITVNDAAPTGLTYSANPATYTKGTVIATNSPSSGGGAVVSYGVSPALPAGLALNTTSGAITGTPTAVTATASYTVTASNTGGSATASLTITVNDAALPSPTGLAVTSITTTTATLSWTASTGATSYNIQASVNSDLSTPLINQTGFSGTSDSITGLTAGTSYYWRVSATNAGGTSGWAVPTPTTFTMLSNAPGVPTLATPTNGATGVSLNPTLTWNSATNASSYELQVSTNSGFSPTVYDQAGITGTSQAVTGVSSNSTVYYWRVDATNVVGTSAWATAYTFTTIVGAPAVPTLATPTNGATGVSLNPTLTWNSATNASSYELQVSTNSGFSSTVYDHAGITGTSQAVTGVSSNSTVYYWRVDATNAAGTSAWATAYNFTTIMAVSAAPTGLAAGNVTQTTATLSWTASGGATSYNIQASTSSGFSPLTINQTGFSGTSDPITGLAPSATYYWQVSAVNAGGSSGWAVPSPTSFTTAPSSPSGALSTVWFQGSTTTGLPGSPATLKGNLATSNTGFGTGWTPTIALASGTPGPYHWYSNTLSETYSAGTWTDTTITAASTGSYSIALYETNSDGSNPVQIGNSTTVTNHTGGGNNINIATLTTNSPTTFSNQRLRLTVTWVSGSVTMAFAVTGFISKHGPTLGTPAIMAGPPAPTNLAVTGITTTTATLSWTASSGATSYNIQVSTSSGFSPLTINQVGFSGTSDPITGLIAGTTYYWQVSATNSGGTSQFSPSGKFATIGLAKRRAHNSVSLKTGSFSARGFSASLFYEIPEECFVSVKYYDLKGRVVGSFVNKMQGSGTYLLSLPMVTGIYIQDFKAGNFADRKMITITK